MLRRYVLASFFCIVLTSALAAGTKEQLIQLQTDVLDLQTKLVSLQKNTDANAKLVRDLLIQIKDDLGLAATAVKDINKRMLKQEGEADANYTDLIKQIRALGEKLDDGNQRLSVLADKFDKMRLKEEPAKPGVVNAPPADELYTNAYKDFLSTAFDLSLQEFQDFLRFYPNSDRAPEAQYYIGESYYGLKRYGEAIKAFAEVTAKYPTAAVNAPALLKAGLAHFELGNRPDAINRLQTVIEKYPEAPEASIAKKRLELMGVGLKPAAPSRPKPGRSTTKRRS
ncbi:MAG: tol-pal system protein YbgF [Acidobacteria bacterium]|nr:tol-pal system protein YbgF [Acidobacteriota bacterium]MBI3657089.1 tol-pal system protein YbgF [Acidobacteriota bacterium]